MGQQTCMVMVGFAALHIAVILSIVSLSTPEWISGDSVNATGVGRNDSHCDQGLWEVCCIECEKLNSTGQTASLRATKGLMLCGCIVMAFGTLLMYGFLCGDKMKTSAVCGAFIALVVTLAASANTVAIIVFGVKYREAELFPTDLQYSVDLGYSYWIGVSCVAVSVVAALCTLRLVCLMKARPVGYENI